MYCSPRRATYGFTLRGPASRLTLGDSWPSLSSRSLPRVGSVSRGRFTTGLAGIGTLGAAAVEGFSAGLDAPAATWCACAWTALGLGSGAAALAAGLAAGFATGRAGAG